MGNKAKKVVVIGTGAGGLAASALLAKRGMEVVALERAIVTGGYLNSFKRKGFHFDPGLHYIGECYPGGMVHRMFTQLGLDPEDLFCEMDPDGFDHFRFPDFTIKMGNNIDTFRQRLVDQFPEEKKGIDRFFKIARELEELSIRMNRVSLGKVKVSDISMLRHMPSAIRWIRGTFADLIGSCTKNPQLAAVLAANCGDYGLPPSRASAFYGMMLWIHYGRGSYFPRGGTTRLKRKIIEVIEGNGGTIRTKADVSEILTSNNKVTGVRLSDGEEISADAVISAIEPAITFGQLLSSDVVPSRLQKKIATLEPSVGTFVIFLGMNRDLRKHGLGAFNVWDYPHYDLEALYGPLSTGRLPKEVGFFLSPNSLKQDSQDMTPPGGSTLEIVTAYPYEPFAAWDGMSSNKRGPQYEELKKKSADVILDAVKKRWPDLIGDVVVEEYATPVTNSYWVNAVRGGAYGPAATPKQIGPWRFMPQTSLKGLFLAGAGVFGGGVTPALSSGIISAKLAMR